LVFLITISSGFGEKNTESKKWWFQLFQTPQRTSVYERTSHFVGGFLTFLKSPEICGYIHQNGILIDYLTNVVMNLKNHSRITQWGV
jgi:hypothetical protein